MLEDYLGVSFWTRTSVTRLVKLWNLGHSAREVAGKLGTSRSAVLGKVDRLRKLGVWLRSRDN